MKIKRGSVYTDFNKSVEGSVGLNFSLSGRQNCDVGCKLYEKLCYASTGELRYKDFNKKLKRHYRNGALWVVNKAHAELNGQTIPWARISTHGSLPARGSMTAREWRVFARCLRELVIEWLKREAFVHIPVESWAKARTYRAVFKGLDVVVRRTVQGSIQDVIAANDPVAWVVGEPHRGCVTKVEVARNITLAYEIARRLRAMGKTVVVCAAIAGNSKCGKCLACAFDVDVVLYPFHG